MPILEHIDNHIWVPNDRQERWLCRDSQPMVGHVWPSFGRCSPCGLASFLGSGCDMPSYAGLPLFCRSMANM